MTGLAEYLSTLAQVHLVYHSIGQLRAGPEWSMAAHAHPFHQLIVLLHGRERARLLDHDLTAGPGELLFFPSGAAHAEWAVDREGLETYYLGFAWQPVPSELPLLLRDRRGRVRRLATWLSEERDAHDPEADERRLQIMRTLILELQHLLQPEPETPITRVRELMRARLHERLDLDDLAAAARLSKFHLVRLYRRQVGSTPMADLRQLRLDAARELLLTSELPLRVIATRTGFADESHCSRLLKRQFGMGARELRGRA